MISSVWSGRSRIACFACVVSICALLPQATTGQVRFGLIAGPTYATLRGGLIREVEPAFGATLGLQLLFTPSSRWMIGLETKFIQKGGSNVPFAVETVDYRLSFLELPITIHYAAFILGDWWVGPHVGFAVGANLGCDYRVGTAFGYSTCTRTSPGGEAMGAELGIPFGVSARKVYGGGSVLMLEARYALGITPVLETADGSASDTVVEIRFGFAIPLQNVSH